MTPLPVEWGVAGRPLPGQPESGDRHLVKLLPGGVLVAAVDGLGHGPEAAEAGRIAVATLESHAGEPAVALVRLCHEALRQTRGVAMTLAWIRPQDNTMDWLGVGNVEGVLWRADPWATPPRDYVVLRGGVVGYELPTLRSSTVSLERGDTLILASDGIRSRFTEGLSRSDPPQRIADRILATHGRSSDDALVLVVRYWGTAP